MFLGVNVIDAGGWADTRHLKPRFSGNMLPDETRSRPSEIHLSLGSGAGPGAVAQENISCRYIPQMT